MACFSSLGIGLSFVFGCIFLGLVGELYYVLWWKKKRNTRSSSRGIDDHYYTNYVKEIPNLFCWKKPNSVETSKAKQVTNSVTNPDSINAPDPDLELGSSKDLLPKGFEFDDEETVEAELIRLHNLCGPPRFLFTINEETKEDLESEDGKSRGDRSRKGSRTKSLSDFLVAVETPILTPLASPKLMGNSSLECYNHHGFNPLFESFTEAEMNKLRSSPPPKFKFLRDAEEKLMRKLMEEVERKGGFNHGGSGQDSAFRAHPPSSIVATEEKGEREGGSFIRIVVGKNKERDQYHSNASQVLPLASSPSTFRPFASSKSIEQ